MTGVVLDLEPGGLRELHWHPNADEWQYVIRGDFNSRGAIDWFSTHGRLRGSRNMHERLLSPYATQIGAHDTVPSARRGASRL